MIIFQLIGSNCLMLLHSIGRFSVFTWQTLSSAFYAPWYVDQFAKQLFQMGFLSLPVVALTAVFTGMVLALQSYTGFTRFNAESAIPTVVVLSMTRELGPVLAGLMVAGRVGASTAAEIGSMRVTEQIDAMITLSTNPFKYLIFPRLLANIISLPCLVIIADSIGVMGGYLVSVYKIGLNPTAYIDQTYRFLEYQDVLSGLLKAVVFGVIIALVGSYHGYNSLKGAEGVGSSATKAVVASSMMILLFNFILTAMLFNR